MKRSVYLWARGTLFAVIFIMAVTTLMQINYQTKALPFPGILTDHGRRSYKRSVLRDVIGVHIVNKKQLAEEENAFELSYSDVTDAELYRDVAIIVPYRERQVHLKIFSRYMNTFLSFQNINYTIYVIEQEKGSLFNRAKLMNIGWREAMREHNYNCLIFHDVDLLPENINMTYGCQIDPVHMSVAIDTMNYSLPYRSIFGGVSALRPDIFEKTNGFSNFYWGWGGEDDDMSRRLKSIGVKIKRRLPSTARYTMLGGTAHQSSKATNNRYYLLRGSEKRIKRDGLNSLKYHIISKENKQLYQHIFVDVLPPRGALELP